MGLSFSSEPGKTRNNARCGISLSPSVENCPPMMSNPLGSPPRSEPANASTFYALALMERDVVDFVLAVSEALVPCLVPHSLL